MEIQTGLRSQTLNIIEFYENSLKAIIRTVLSNRKILIQQNKQSEIVYNLPKAINLDDQINKFLLFHKDSSIGYHWIDSILQTLSKETQIFSLHQFRDIMLLAKNQDITQIQICEEQTAQKSVQQMEIKFCPHRPKDCLFIITFEIINKDWTIFIVRNYVGQIIFLSTNSINQKKSVIIEKFCREFQPSILLIIDSINNHLSASSQITQKQFQKLEEFVQLIYLKINQTYQIPLLHLKEPSSFYNIKYDSIFTKIYNKQGQKNQNQIKKFAIIGNILKAHQIFICEEMIKFIKTKNQKKLLIREILIINYKRKKQQSISNLKEFFRFQHFIQSEILIYESFKTKKPMTQNVTHSPSNYITQEYCCYCPQNSLSRNKANQTCPKCNQGKQKKVLLCSMCFTAFHQKMNSLKGQFSNQYPQSSKAQSKKEFKKIDQLNDKMNTSQQNNKNQKKRFQSAKSTKKQNNDKFKINWSQLSQEDIEKMKQLKQSGGKIFALFQKLRNSSSFYKSSKINLESQKDCQKEMKNQLSYHTIIDRIILQQMEIFQNEMFLSLVKKKELPTPVQKLKCKKVYKSKVQKQSLSMIDEQKQGDGFSNQFEMDVEDLQQVK